MRPTLYDEKVHCPIAWALSIKGLTDKEIAEAMGIAVRTLNNWKEMYPEFMQSLKEGKFVADSNVEAALYKRAVGYTVKKKKIVKKNRNRKNDKKEGEKEQDENNEEEVLTGEEYEVQPDVTACIFWLKNRKPKEWRDRNDIEIKPNNEKEPSRFIQKLTEELVSEAIQKGDNPND